MHALCCTPPAVSQPPQHHWITVRDSPFDVDADAPDVPEEAAAMTQMEWQVRPRRDYVKGWLVTASDWISGIGLKFRVVLRISRPHNTTVALRPQLCLPRQCVARQPCATPAQISFHGTVWPPN